MQLCLHVQPGFTAIMHPCLLSHHYSTWCHLDGSTGTLPHTLSCLKTQTPATVNTELPLITLEENTTKESKGLRDCLPVNVNSMVAFMVIRLPVPCWFALHVSLAISEHENICKFTHVQHDIRWWHKYVSTEPDPGLFCVFVSSDAPHQYTV